MDTKRFADALSTLHRAIPDARIDSQNPKAFVEDALKRLDGAAEDRFEKAAVRTALEMVQGALEDEGVGALFAVIAKMVSIKDSSAFVHDVQRSLSDSYQGVDEHDDGRYFNFWNHTWTVPYGRAEELEHELNAFLQANAPPGVVPTLSSELNFVLRVAVDGPQHLGQRLISRASHWLGERVEAVSVSEHLGERVSPPPEVAHLYEPPGDAVAKWLGSGGK